MSVLTYGYFVDYETETSVIISNNKLLRLLEPCTLTNLTVTKPKE